MTWPKPVQKPHPPVILGGAFPWAARRAIRYGNGWYPNAASGNPEEYLPAFRKMTQDAGRDPSSLPVTIGSEEGSRPASCVIIRKAGRYSSGLPLAAFGYQPLP